MQDVRSVYKLFLFNLFFGLFLFCFAHEYPAVLAPFVEKAIISSLDCICSFVKD